MQSYRILNVCVSRKLTLVISPFSYDVINDEKSLFNVIAYLPDGVLYWLLHGVRAEEGIGLIRMVRSDVLCKNTCECNGNCNVIAIV